jgi:membrane protein DedA with SNARE-associated domain
MVYLLSGIFLLLLGYLGGQVINLRDADVFIIAAGWILLVIGAVQLVLARRG